MNHRHTAILPTLLAIVCLAPAAQAGQPASAGIPPVGSPAPRMPWGVPDLEGVWDHGTATPMERPARYEGREFLTAEEIAEVNLNATTFATSERRSELSPARDVGLAYNQFWWDRGLSDGRTALIVDPSRRENPATHGRGRRARGGPARGCPTARELREPRRPQSVGTVSVARHGAAGRFLQQQHPDLPERRPRGDSHGDGPRDAHHPAGRQRAVPDHSPRQWLGSSRGHWEGDTLVVETTHFSGQAPWRGSGEHLTLVERFSRPDGRTLRS